MSSRPVPVRSSCLLVLLALLVLGISYHTPVTGTRGFLLRKRDSSRNECHGKIASPLHAVKVALTREQGANQKLKDLLQPYQDIECVEIPCIQFADGPDQGRLETEIRRHDLALITSPHAARVFLQSFSKILPKSSIHVASIGNGTSQVLLEGGVAPCFESTDAQGDAFARVLPFTFGKKVLYSSSALADNSLVDILNSRGFEVTRLKAYTTVPATWTLAEENLSKDIDLVTFASPSTMKVWRERVGCDHSVVVIGRTTEEAAKKLGFKEVYCPVGDSKGLIPWAQLILERAKKLKEWSAEFNSS